jgi:hypothetical protein
MVSGNQQLGALAALLLAFMLVPQISELLGRSLDTVPFRIAATLLILVAVGYDKFVALGAFLVIAAVYIQHHQNDLLGLETPGQLSALSPYEIPIVKPSIQHGGHADEIHEPIDYMPRSDATSNKFKPVDVSHDEKHALESEVLGSRAQVLFKEDTQHAAELEHGNRDGHANSD